LRINLKVNLQSILQTHSSVAFSKEVMMKNRSRFTRICSLIIFMLFSFFAAPVTAEVDYSVVSTDEVKAMVDQKASFTLIDARTSQEYQEAHIVGAINIPEKNLEGNLGILPADKNSLLVIYCNGVKCGKSKRLARKLEPLGYRNIKIYSDGIPVWEERNLPIVPGPDYGKKIETQKVKAADLAQLIRENKGDYVLVDVRDSAEYREGHIPTAINIPAETFSTQSGVLPKEKKIIVYCNSGSRSYLAYRKLLKLAYPDIYQTLLADWKEAGFAVEK